MTAALVYVASATSSLMTVDNSVPLQANSSLSTLDKLKDAKFLSVASLM